MYFDNVDLRDAPELIPLRAAWKFPCYSTYVNWICIFHETGDICPKRAKGNHHAVREIQCINLEQLGLYRSVSPKATIAKRRAYLFNLDSTKEPYSDSQVHQAECLLGLRRKTASTTADLAFLPVNLQKREFYWTLPPPLGMRGVPIADIIDIDEAGFFLEHSDQRHGKTPSCLCCSQNGVYGRGEKVNLLLAICGNDVGRMRWHKQWMHGGTAIERFF